MPDRLPCCVCIWPLVDELPPIVVMVPPAISPEALILVIPLNALLHIKRRLKILMPLRELHAMKIVEPDVKVKSVAPLVATS